jgi:4-diphosphocytidyl-2-C-methyl-D-erythritol kinase
MTVHRQGARAAPGTARAPALTADDQAGRSGLADPAGFRRVGPELAPAKLNLSLEILGRRADGYHELQSLVAFADFGDVVSLDTSAHTGPALSVEGPYAQAIDTDNLVLRAAEAFLGVHDGARAGQFHLIKNIPVAAGLGGGSSDAAAALRLLMRAHPDADADQVQGRAARLGADVPVCLLGQAAWMTGIGEQVQALAPLPPLYAVLVNPGTRLSTRDVFAALGAGPLDGAYIPAVVPGPFAAISDLIDYLHAHPNDLEAPARRLSGGVIDTLLHDLRALDGCLLARLSGSGPTCYGLFATPAEAAHSATSLGAARPAWWVRAVRLS